MTPHARSRRLLRAVAALAVAALLAPSPAPAAAPIEFHAIIDDSHGQPPFNGSPVRGIGHLTLNDTQDLLSYDLTFDPWITTVEIAAHFHLDSTGVEIHDLEPGAHKAGTMVIQNGLVLQTLLEGRLFVRVHSQSVRNGEVGGWVMLGTPAATATWGRLKALYR